MENVDVIKLRLSEKYDLTEPAPEWMLEDDPYQEENRRLLFEEMIMDKRSTFDSPVITRLVFFKEMDVDDIFELSMQVSDSLTLQYGPHEVLRCFNTIADLILEKKRE